MQKFLVKTASRLFPNKIVDFAYHKLTSPQVMKLRDNELEVLSTSKQEKIKFKGFDIQTYFWKGGDKKVLLIHGWEGQAGNFADVIQELIKKNYTIYAFDAPSHGFSSKGKTSLFEFTELVGVLIRKFEVTRLISHSFGGVATTFALYNNLDLKIEKYALLTTPDKFSERIEDISIQVGITDKVKKHLINRLEKETGMAVNTLNVSNFVKTINVEKALIIHDKNDKVLPISHSKNVCENWGDTCNFIEIEGTGHFRILRTPSVVEKTISFLES